MKSRLSFLPLLALRYPINRLNSCPVSGAKQTCPDMASVVNDRKGEVHQIDIFCFAIFNVINRPMSALLASARGPQSQETSVFLSAGAVPPRRSNEPVWEVSDK